MKPLFNTRSIEQFTRGEKLPFECEFCSSTFYVRKSDVKKELRKPKNYHKYCCKQCQWNSQIKSEDKKCSECSKDISVSHHIVTKSKTGHFFCSQSCAAKYNNTHKIKGTKRSKLEVWIESQLTQTFPNLEIIYNNKEIINSELDVYFPSLRLAVELNGIFHYEPIYGQEKLASIQNNDNRKFQACLELGIELVIIDTSSLINFKPDKAKKYLDIIYGIVLQKLGVLQRTGPQSIL